MKLVLLSVLVVATLSFTAGAQTPAPTASGEGPFTKAQATRGKEVYARACAACHGPDLQGATSIPLVGSRFQARWRYPTLTADDL